MAEPIKIQKAAYSASDLRDLSIKIQQPMKEFIDLIRRMQEKPSLVDDAIQLGHFAKSIMALNATTQIAKGLD